MKHFLNHSNQFAIWLLQQLARIFAARARFYQTYYDDLNKH
ncbi:MULTISPECIES: hypothetical protein [Acinetobacter]|jgi:hypothetical protein|uniref:Uncharacterized protein n=1 Tax=Acinetobacter puyangensis TaxID=1096779 RepID=A0A240E6T0_9GAMM|nr:MULTISPECIES: hypothetical protein [Acinetobacter]SNX43943.1 hypothetical protein SAMN05421731_102101 [Acinetobacter puyangensis]